MCVSKTICSRWYEKCPTKKNHGKKTEDVGREVVALVYLRFI